MFIIIITIIIINVFFLLLSYIVTFLELHDALFIVGARDETLTIYGMRYHPVDIEATVLRSHRKICEW